MNLLETERYINFNIIIIIEFPRLSDFGRKVLLLLIIINITVIYTCVCCSITRYVEILKLF